MDDYDGIYVHIYLFTKTNDVYVDLFFLQLASQLSQFLVIKVDGRSQKHDDSCAMIFSLPVFES